MASVKLWDDKLNGYSGCTGTAVVNVVINANNMQKGCWLLHYIPNYADNPTASSWNTTLCQKSQHPGVMFTTDAMEGDSITLKIPYVAPSSYYKLSNGKYDWGRVFLTVVSPLKNGINAVVTDVTGTVFVHFEDFKLVVPTVQALMETSPTAGAPISTILNKTAKVVDTLSAIPPLAAYAKPTVWALKGAAKTAAAFGYSKPTYTNTPMIAISNVAKYSANSNGANGDNSLSMFSDNVIKGITYISPRSEDEMSFNYLKRIQSYYTTFNWAQGDGIGSAIHTQSISPALYRTAYPITTGGHTITAYTYAPFAHVARLFNSWRGSIEITFKAISTVESGRLKFMLTPSPDTPASATLDMTVMSVVMDLTKEREVTMVVPFMSQYHYLGFTDPVGTLTVQVLTKLKMPETVANNVDILVFVRAGKDFEVQGPVPSLMTPVVALMESNITFGDQPIRPATTSYAEECIGEYFSSVKQKLTRCTYMNSSTATTYYGANANVDYLDAVGLDGAGALVGPTWGGGPYTNVIAMYAYRRGANIMNMGGSIHYLTTKGTNVINGYGTSSIVSRALDWKTAYPNTMGVTNSMAQPGSGSRCPYMCDTPFTINRLQKGDTAYTDGDETWCSVATATASAGLLTPWRQYADDFQCGFFVATPLVFGSYA